MDILSTLAICLLLEGIFFLLIGLVLIKVLRKYYWVDRLRGALIVVGVIYSLSSVLVFILFGLYKLAYGY
jgi:hypothetical protein